MGSFKYPMIYPANDNALLPRSAGETVLPEEEGEYVSLSYPFHARVLILIGPEVKLSTKPSLFSQMAQPAEDKEITSVEEALDVISRWCVDLTMQHSFFGNELKAKFSALKEAVNSKLPERIDKEIRNFMNFIFTTFLRKNISVPNLKPVLEIAFPFLLEYFGCYDKISVQE